MLSHDELTSGSTFILKLRSAAGVPSQWVATLRGDTARRWYDIYRNSDWDALRAEAPAVFRNSVTESEAERARTSRRCVVIHTTAVTVEELGAPPPWPPTPGWQHGWGASPPHHARARPRLCRRHGMRILVVDMGWRSGVAGLFEPGADEVEYEALTGSREAFARLIESKQPDRVVIEPGPMVWWVRGLCQSMHVKLLVLQGSEIETLGSRN